MNYQDLKQRVKLYSCINNAIHKIKKYFQVVEDGILDFVRGIHKQQQRQ